MKRWSIQIVLIYGLLIFPVSGIHAQKPFQLQKEREIQLLSGGILSCAIGGYFYLNVPPPDYKTLNRNDLFGLDRFAIDLYCQDHDLASDILSDFAIGFPVLIAATSFHGQTLFDDMVMYLESVLFMQGVILLCKGVFRRPRPYSYDSEGPLSISVASSFVSGHTASAFNGAVFAGSVFRKRYPDSPWITPVWIVGLTAATATAVLRVTSGKHFPTDVLAGAAVGSFTGWLIPRLHDNKSKRFSITLTDRIGILYQF